MSTCCGSKGGHDVKSEFNVGGRRTIRLLTERFDAGGMPFVCSLFDEYLWGETFLPTLRGKMGAPG